MAVDIVINETIDSVDITVTPNIIEVNVTRTSGGGAGSQTLAQTLDLGNSTGGENILINNGDAIELENGSKLSEGLYDEGTFGNKGIARTCAVGYEDKWEAGEQYITETGSGIIQFRRFAFNVPTVDEDTTKRYAVGSYWQMRNNDIYICTDATEGAAVWELHSVGGIPTLQDVTDAGNTTTNAITVGAITAGNLSYDGFQFLITDDLEESIFMYTPFVGIAISSLEQNTSVDIGIDATIVFTKSTGSAVLSANLLTGVRSLELPDADGTIALTSDIPTTTSQLTNDGADGVNPFITALDIPVGAEASTLVREVKNMTGATLTKGTVVFISGANGNKALVQKAIATTDALSARTFGLLQSDILNNGLGNCVIIGDLSGINTSAFAEGAQLYLSGTVAGAFTDTRVLAPTHLVYVGKVTRSHPTQGQIEVQIQNGYELAEIHDVQIVTPLNNQTILYETSSELWKNKTIIEDSITNGVTDIAPSQNAVFDALALKQNTSTLIFDSFQKAIIRDNYFWFLPNTISSGVGTVFAYSERVIGQIFNYGGNGSLLRGLMTFSTTATAGTIAFMRRNDGIILTGLEVVITRKIQFNSNVSGQRFFCGISKGYQFSAPTNVEPNTLTDIVGVCQLSSSTNMHVIHNDASGTATTIDLGSSYPCTDSQYNYFITIEQTTTTYIVTVERVTVATGASISTTSTLATNIPNYATGTMQIATWMSNNATAAIASYLDGGAIGNIKNQ
jgi:hypothetical protein